MTPVSANIMGLEEVFIVGVGSFMYIMKTRALELIPGELLALLSQRRRKNSVIR
jgi:hypothetical protein